MSPQTAEAHWAPSRVNKNRFLWREHHSWHRQTDTEKDRRREETACLDLEGVLCMVQVCNGERILPSA